MSITVSLTSIRSGVQKAFNASEEHLTCPIDIFELSDDVEKVWRERDTRKMSELIALGLIYRAQVIGEI